MARPATFLVPEDEAAAAQEEDHEQGPELQPEDGDTDRTPRKAGRKRKAPDSPVTVPNGKARAPLVPDLGPRFKEIETLHALWASAGKSINLWDWLEGFRNALDDKPKEDGADAGEVNGEGQGDGEGEGEGGQGTTNGRQTDEDAADKEQAQHATFVRFIEECRMLGLVRARGSRTARRTDEVVKGVLMI
jgi:hypothetical protein